jgi:F-type H+-transporting ATPase subunit b
MRLDLWTLALQTINVLVLVWLLARFLFRPIAGIIAERRASADALMADTEAARAKVAADAAALARERQGLAGDGERIVAAARTTAEAERAVILHLADDAAGKLRNEAEQAIARERQAMREALEHDAADLALAIATRLVGRLPVQMMNRVFLEGLAEVLATHPARASIVNAPLEIRSATPLDATSQSDCRAVLARLLDGTPEVSFRTDPALIAGIELAGPDVVVRNSWRADLQRLTSVLHEDTSNDVASQHVA